MRVKQLLLFPLLLVISQACSQDIPNKEAQIGAAVMAAPKDQRANATVLGFNSKGELVTLRKGTNKLICLADDPNKDGFNVACYHQDLEPFMARGRALKKEGKKMNEIFDIRAEEVKNGKLKMPSQPTTLHILSGSKGEYNLETNEVLNAKYRYVVYIPFATSESTGLPTSPVVKGGPWIMNPGTHRAHIMISTPD